MFILIFEKFVLNHCDVVIAQSPGVKNYMLKIYGSQLESKIRIVHTGVDQEKFHVPPKEEGMPQVLFVGALSEIKGVTCLLNTFVTAHKDVPIRAWSSWAAGPGPPSTRSTCRG